MYHRAVAFSPVYQLLDAYVLLRDWRCAVLVDFLTNLYFVFVIGYNSHSQKYDCRRTDSRCLVRKNSTFTYSITLAVEDIIDFI